MGPAPSPEARHARASAPGQEPQEVLPDPRRPPLARGRARACRGRRVVRDPAGRDARPGRGVGLRQRSEEHTSELQSLAYLVCRLLLEKKKKIKIPSLFL